MPPRPDRDPEDVKPNQADDLDRSSFRVVPHRSGYGEGIDSEQLKAILGELDDDQFTEKNAK